MNIAEYLIKCPVCYSETKLVAEESNPLIYHCSGCNRSVVIHNNSVFTVSEEYTKKLVRRYKSKACGRVLAYQVSEDAKKFITEEKIKDLQKMLTLNMDVKDFVGTLNFLKL
jgi:transposase-like protein